VPKKVKHTMCTAGYMNVKWGEGQGRERGNRCKSRTKANT